MKLAISNLAWPSHEGYEISKILHARNIHGLEIAPNRLFNNPTNTTLGAENHVVKSWHKKGVSLIAMQSLIYNRPELQLFGSEDSRREMFDHLVSMIYLAHRLGIHTLVFGSSQNRIMRGTDPFRAKNIAIEFFNKLGDEAAKIDSQILIEPVSARYKSSDFATTTAETLKLVQEISHKNIGLNFDTGTMAMNRENPSGSISLARDHIRHVHISEPWLEVIGSTATNHSLVASCLKEIGYNGWVSIEMLSTTPQIPNNIAICDAIDFAGEHYLS
jgi:D-psicose/D-tagatose/L-ribulose 3-epimerase